jgi:hypothetical protein
MAFGNQPDLQQSSACRQPLTSHLIKLFNGLHQRRSRQRPMSRLVQQAHRFLDLLSFSAVTRQQLGLAFGMSEKASIGRGRDRG